MPYQNLVGHESYPCRYIIYTQPRYQYYDWNTSFWNCSWTYPSNTFWAFCNSLPSVPSWRSIKSLDLSFFFSTGIPYATWGANHISYVSNLNEERPIPTWLIESIHVFLYHTLKTYSYLFTFLEILGCKLSLAMHGSDSFLISMACHFNPFTSSENHPAHIFSLSLCFACLFYWIGTQYTSL